MTIARCEVRGVVGRFHSEASCPFAASWAVSVEGLSPVMCCKTHSIAMRKFWGACYEVRSTAIPREAAA